MIDKFHTFFMVEAYQNLFVCCKMSDKSNTCCSWGTSDKGHVLHSKCCYDFCQITAVPVVNFIMFKFFHSLSRPTVLEESKIDTLLQRWPHLVHEMILDAFCILKHVSTLEFFRKKELLQSQGKGVIYPPDCGKTS